MDQRISVIVPIYKVEAFLNRCVDSILNQSYRNLEIILVDDGSPDNCGLICDEYARWDERIVVVHKKNGGLSSARNAGLDIATGEYIGFVDSDDYLAPDMYEKMYKALTESESDLCICGTSYVDEEGAPFHQEIPSTMCDEILDQKSLYAKLQQQDYFYYVTAWTKLYRSEVFADIRFPEGRLHEDEFTAHHVFGKCTRTVTLEEPLYYYVQRAGSIMNSGISIKKVDAAWAFYDRYLYFKERNYPAGAKQALRRSYGILLLLIRNLGWWKYRNELKQITGKVVWGLRFDLRVVKLLLEIGKAMVRDIANKGKGND